MQRSSRYSWRAELDTAVRMGASSWFMLAMMTIVVIARDGGGRASGRTGELESWNFYCIARDSTESMRPTPRRGSNEIVSDVDARCADHIDCTKAARY